MADRKLIKFPFAYEVKGVAAGHRKPDTHIFIDDDLTVEVRFLSEAEAPVGLVVKKGAHTFAYRALEGRPLLPLTDRGKVLPFVSSSTPMSFEDLCRRTELIAARQTGGGPFEITGIPPREYGLGLCADLPRAGEMKMRSLGGSNIDEARAAAVERTRLMCVIDGVVHIEAPEPLWSVDLMGVPASVVAHVVEGPRAVPMLSNCFRMDRGPEARHLAKDRARWNKAVARAEEIQDFGIINWAFDDIGHSMASVRHLLIQALESPETVHLPRSVFDPLLDLRDIAAQQFVAPADREKFADGLRRLHETVRISKSATVGGNDLLGRLRGVVRAARYRFDTIENMAPQVDSEFAGLTL